MSKTTIERCSCVHAYQDKKYGPGKRVHNLGEKKARCTVCEHEKSTN